MDGWLNRWTWRMGMWISYKWTTADGVILLTHRDAHTLPWWPSCTRATTWTSWRPEVCEHMNEPQGHKMWWCNFVGKEEGRWKGGWMEGGRKEGGRGEEGGKEEGKMEGGGRCVLSVELWSHVSSLALQLWVPETSFLRCFLEHGLALISQFDLELWNNESKRTFVGVNEESLSPLFPQINDTECFLHRNTRHQLQLLSCEHISDRSPVCETGFTIDVCL